VILATVGTAEPFDRLLRALEPLAPGEQVVAQYGESSARPRGTTLVQYLAFEDLIEHMRRARVVITHAGVGSIMTARGVGQHPVVVPRLAALGEAVDDHQLHFARRLAAAGLVTLVEDVDRLPSVVAPERPAVDATKANGRLAGELKTYLAGTIGRPPDAVTPA
jgi:UDP-N-acetylglucosamine transferase subunit ALG13